jgi:hypothetical protein
MGDGANSIDRKRIVFLAIVVFIEGDEESSQALNYVSTMVIKI